MDGMLWRRLGGSTVLDGYRIRGEYYIQTIRVIKSKSLAKNPLIRALCAPGPVNGSGAISE